MQMPKIHRDLAVDIIGLVKSTRRLTQLLGKLNIVKDYKFYYTNNKGSVSSYGIGLKDAKEFTERHLSRRAIKY